MKTIETKKMIDPYNGYHRSPIFEGYESQEYPFTCDYFNLSLNKQVRVPIQSIEEAKKELGIK